ncbi:MAG: hypothetical protein AB1762_03275 [Gemmatimonadota bacterium]
MWCSRFTRSGALALALILSACSGKEGGGRADSTATPQDVAAAAPAGAAAAQLQAIPLSEGDVEHFIAATKELHALGAEVHAELGDDPSKVQSWTTAIQANAEAMSILRKHTFDIPRYQQVAMSVMMAYAAEDVKKSQVDMKAQMEQMKATLPKEQYEQMQKANEQAQAMLKAYENQPQSNIDLVAKYRAQIDEISKQPR